MAKRIVIFRNGGEYISSVAEEETEVLVVDRMTEFAEEGTIKMIDGDTGICQTDSAINDAKFVNKLWNQFEGKN